MHDLAYSREAEAAALLLARPDAPLDRAERLNDQPLVLHNGDATSTAKAKASGKNRGAVEQMGRVKRERPCCRPLNGDMPIRNAFQISGQFALGVPEDVRILKA